MEEYSNLKQLLVPFLKLLKSHGKFTEREYKSDHSYNNESIGYKEEEEAINAIRTITGKSIIEVFKIWKI